MEEIKAPKKERKFLKAMGDIALTLFRELVLGIGKKVINKVGNKRQGLLIGIIILASCLACAQYPTNGNKQRLGFQTTADGLVYRGRSNDTTTIKSSGLNNAYHIYDTINNVLYSYVKTKGGWVFSNGDTIIINNNFTQPVDSLFFNVGVPTNNVDTAKMRWDSDLGTVVLGLNDNVPNELGFKNFWLVKNQTGATITKGSIVYANGTVGTSGRITVAKFIANGSIDAKYLLGITAHDLTDGEDGYVISFGKIRQVNTDTFAAGAILYPSPTVAGVWTDIEPIAPNIDMPIGFCINSSVNNGTISIRVASGYKLSELHDLAISSPVENSSLYYKSGLWRDTTAALLVSDTASMLTNYLRTAVAASTYQPILVSGTNIKTINSNSLLGSGNISIGGVTSVSGSGAISSSGGNTPVISVADAAFGTPGIVTSTGTQQFSGDKVFEGITQFNARAVFKDYTYIATKLAGLSSTDRFSTVTIGTGLSLASGTLSATGGGVTSVTASTPLSSSGGATPNITITDAGTLASGVVNTTTQSFAGNKTFTGTLDVSSTGTFGGRVKTNWLERNYAYSTSSSFTVSVNTTWQDINTSVLTTLTLPNAATYPGKELNIRQSGTGQLQSASSNVIPFTSPPTGSTGTAILNPTNNKAVTLVSDGTNWIIMQRSTN
tara:strand:+ start:112 stop:2103 length:1992 start_codon:yes stop_codon:yes gene_type:complete